MIDKTDERVLNIIIDEIEKIMAITSKYSFEEISNNYIFADSIEFEFQKMDYDLKRLSPRFRIDHPEFPFSEVKGIRNRVAHNYESVNLTILYDTANKDFPNFKETIIKILEEKNEN